MEDLKADPRYEEARRHAHNVRGFYTHLTVYVLVNAGLAAHAVSVFACRGWMGAEWEERKIREYLAPRP